MNSTPYRAGNVAIGLMYRRRPPIYADPYEGHIPMKRSTRNRMFRFLWWFCVAAVLFVFIAALLLHRVHV